MTQAKNLCEIVRNDRISAGLNQDRLAAILNKTENRPIDVQTKKPKIASRTWISKLETGLLKRDLSLSTRQWLAQALNGDIDLYKTLSISKLSKESFVPGNLDVLPLVKIIAEFDLYKMTFDEFVRFCKVYSFDQKPT